MLDAALVSRDTIIKYISVLKGAYRLVGETGILAITWHYGESCNRHSRCIGQKDRSGFLV